MTKVNSKSAYGRRIARIRWVLIFVVAIIAIGVVYFFRSENEAVLAEFEPEDNEFDHAATTADAPSFSVNNENGNFADLDAQKVQQRAVGSGFDGSVLSGDIVINGTDWTVSADLGFAPPSYDRIELVDNIIATSKNGFEVRTNGAEAFITDGIITSEEFITVSSEQLSISSDSAKISGAQGQRVIEFNGNVEGQIILGNSGLFSREGDFSSPENNSEVE